MSIEFKGSHYLKDVILHAVFFYGLYAVSYRDLGEIRVLPSCPQLKHWLVDDDGYTDFNAAPEGFSLPS